MLVTGIVKPLGIVSLGMLLTVTAVTMSAQQRSIEPTVSELMKVLSIKAVRVRMPLRLGWNIKMIRAVDVKPTGQVRAGQLTEEKGLLAIRELREAGDGVFEFTLPERDGSFSQGKFEMCKEVVCDGQYSLKWLKQPRYSADGSQCLLAEFNTLEQDGDHPSRPSAYLALLKVSQR